MDYSIVGFGAVGQALARAFARKGIEVAVATTREPAAIASTARSIGPTVVPKSLKDALASDVILLAVPFWAHRDVAQALPSWLGKIVIDVHECIWRSTRRSGTPPVIEGDRQCLAWRPTCQSLQSSTG